MFKSVDEDRWCPFALSATPLTSSPISKMEEKLVADDFCQCHATLLLSRLHSENAPCKHTHRLWWTVPSLCTRHLAHGMGGIQMRRCEVWSGLGHSRFALASGNVWREIRLCLKRSSRCSYITGCLVMPLIKAQRSCCRQAEPHTDTLSQER